MAYLILLRFIHIVFGAFWFGGTFYLAAFVVPAVKALGPDGAKFMQQLTRTNKLPVVMVIAATFSVIAGLLLMYEISRQFTLEWFGTPHGIVLTTGGILALVGYAIGVGINFPLIIRMGKIGKAVANSGNPPTALQQQELQKMRSKLFYATNILAIILLCAIACMSVARYF